MHIKHYTSLIVLYNFILQIKIMYKSCSKPKQSHVPLKKLLCMHLCQLMHMHICALIEDIPDYVYNFYALHYSARAIVALQTL